ncbi:hypothetical protein ACWDE9_02975 [Streptomyces olivaceoviridis]
MEDRIGALGPALNAVVFFNAGYVGTAVNQLRTEGFDVLGLEVGELSAISSAVERQRAEQAVRHRRTTYEPAASGRTRPRLAR